MHSLAVSLQAARRIEEDVNDIVQVVSTWLSQSTAAPQEEIMSLVPSNIDHPFPYGAVSFDSHTQWPKEQLLDIAEGTPGFGVDLYYDNFHGMEPNDNEFQHYGVPWI